MGWIFNPFTGNLDKTGQGGAGPVVSPLEEFTFVVAPGATEVIYSYDFSLFSGSKVFFSATNTLNLKYKTYDCTVSRFDSTISDMINRVGVFDMSVLINLNGANIELVVTNNEPFAATLNGYRLNF